MVDTTETKTSNIPKPTAPITPFRTADVRAELLFTAGQIGMDPKTGQLVSDDVVEQAKQALKNLEAVLKEGKSSLQNVLKCTVFLTDMADFTKCNEIYAGVFTKPYPARSCVGMKELPKGAKFEIEAIAVIDRS